MIQRQGSAPRALTTVENNFTQGFKTEYSGLNFPENASTDTQNCTFLRTGRVLRRSGIDYELNFTTAIIDRTNLAINTFVWTNAGGDGNSKILVTQVGGTLRFYLLTNATVASPLSTTLLTSTISLSNFIASGGSEDDTLECQFATGNGYLFVFRQDIDPIYCTYTASGPTVTATAITVKIRDFIGIPETVADDFRPSALTDEHKYNLINQGWSATNPWTAVCSASSPVFTLGINASTVVGITSQTNTTSVTVGSTVKLAWVGLCNIGGGNFEVASAILVGVVTIYAAPFNKITINVTSFTPGNYIASGDPSIGQGHFGNLSNVTISLSLVSQGNITTWNSAIGNFPSNSDIWWEYRNTSGVFDPATTIGGVTLDNAPGPKGSLILKAFNQQRNQASGITTLTDTTTLKRPKTGTWFQGRLWFAGVDDSFTASGDMPYYTWTENIYFSQIVTKTSQFGQCYETNDPTSQTRFDLLPSDGGVLVIQGSGSIYKLFPISNGLIVFAANGIWFITGSQGIGFTANDYTITKISGIQSISSTSFVDFNGYPLFWNEEGIYIIAQEKGSLAVNTLTHDTILQYYTNIPLSSKKYVRGSYNPLTGQVQWVFRSTQETGISDRYNFDTILNFLVYTQSFYYWTVSTGPFIHSADYIAGPGGSTSPDPVFKYLTSNLVSGNYQFTFSEERDDENWQDWFSITPQNYNSYFVTGYKLHGDGLRKFNIGKVNVYSNNEVNTSYIIQGIFQYAVNLNSGKFGPKQKVVITASPTNFGKVLRKHRLPGMGEVVQIKVSSFDGQPFDIAGWAAVETQGTG